MTCIDHKIIYIYRTAVAGISICSYLSWSFMIYQKAVSNTIWPIIENIAIINGWQWHKYSKNFNDIEINDIQLLGSDCN